MLNFTNCLDFTQFLTRTNSENVSTDHLHTEFIQTKLNMSNIHLDNHHQFFGSWLITHFNVSWLSWVHSRLASVSAGQCLKFCNDTPSVATISTLSNPQDLDPDYWRPVFWFNELRYIGVQVSSSVVWMVCQCSILPVSPMKVKLPVNWTRVISSQQLNRISDLRFTNGIIPSNSS